MTSKINKKVRIALGVEYNGQNYQGFQKQSHSSNTIQAELESALSKIANQEITIYCAGRTDKKVHATGQVIHFDYIVPDSNSPKNNRKLSSWTMGVNTLLPDDIAIKWAKYSDDICENFHARFSAKARRYKYYIYTSNYKSSLLANRAVWIRKNLNISKMNEACEYLIGEHDFSSFRSSECQSNSPYRNIMSATVYNIDNFMGLDFKSNNFDNTCLVFDIKANAFLHHMVRNIAGCLIEIGLSNREPQWMLDVLNAKDRTKAAKTSNPEGLYLVEVDY